MKLFMYDIATKQKEEMKALVISDLHYASLYDNPKLIDILIELDEQEYDYLFIVGDIIDSTNVLKDEYTLNFLLDFFRNVGLSIPTYIAYGEHDLVYQGKNKDWIKDRTTFYRNFLEKINGFSGINVIYNATYNLKKGYTLSIINKHEKLDRELEAYAFLKRLSASNTNTLLCHNPNTILRLYKLGYLNNVDLSICGHVHSGCTQYKTLLARMMKLLIKSKLPNEGVIFEGVKYNQGIVNLNGNNKMLINPAITTFSDSSGFQYLEPFFYQGASVINYKKNIRILKK